MASTSYTDITNYLFAKLKCSPNADAVCDRFKALPSNQKVSFAYRLLEEEALLPDCTNKFVKSDAKAVEYRNQGNKAFREKNEKKALKLYSKSVCQSTPNSLQLSLAYANRSAVLFETEKIDLCLLDIDRALDNYPDNLKYKLYQRKGKCLLKSGRYAEAKQSFQEALNYLPKAELAAEKTRAFELSLNQSMNGCDRSDRNINLLGSIKKFPLPELPSRNQLIPNASDKLTINFSPKIGRHLIATQAIEPGEVLAVEKPFASILLPEQYQFHCSNCFVRNLAMVPCESCSLIMFCDENCRSKSMARYHATECDMASALLGLGVSKMELLSVRILMIATQQGKNLRSLFNHASFGTPLSDPRLPKSLDIGEIYMSESYETVHLLEDNFSKASDSTSFQRAFLCAFLLHGVSCSPFFENANVNFFSNEDQPLVDFTGTLILKYLFMVLCNAHEVSESVKDGLESWPKMSNQLLEIGAALYPLLSLINHSCDPNVTRHSYHDSIVLRAIQPIAANEQLVDNYGYHFAVHDRETRHEALARQYYFTCDCRACEFDWPLYKNQPSTNPIYLPTSIPPAELGQLSINYKRDLSNLKSLKLDGVLESLIRYLCALYQSVQRPWQEYSECQEAIKECIAYQANSYVFSKDFILILKTEEDD